MGLSDYLGRFWFSSEPMFGVIMVVCFTSLLRAYPSLAELVLGTVLTSALMCCVAWSFVDGIFYVWEAHYKLRNRKKIQAAAKTSDDAAKEERLLEEDLNDTIVDLLDDEHRKQIYQIVRKTLPGIDIGKASLKVDIVTVLTTMGLVVGSSIIVMIPFLIIHPVMTALYISNLAGIIVLFLIGYWREQEKGRKLASGFAVAFIGIIVASVTIALGG